ncbi:epsilon family phenol-soluble modulin [Staphylococcus epidermidis]|uniref:Epsilon family phenol-soluble modulin n=2 Tax=Staphylococcus epidermidis TaxID=1282 RepID=A0AAE5QYL5_STAEP|nr:epsilon family phenol-soluble modulin [Staphylococcus epidermidis]MBA9875468.1 epsilon family phenol-soluble modulin [Ralstonia insidiosa]RQN20014.1 epsilon family phenol-soluble modulin [Paraburkholderia tropica]AVA11535.1 epsilon family phenol-soluble modulin [Staphylococcus epidermidis]AVG08944.1 epsilon family phenol-soluble modulin [Staphylococcus epidermidis]
MSHMFIINLVKKVISFIKGLFGNNENE